MAGITKIKLSDKEIYDINDNRISLTDIENWNTKGIFMCTYGKTNATTYDEITKALNENRLPICYVSSTDLGLQNANFNARMFVFTDSRTVTNTETSDTTNYYYFQSLQASNEQLIKCDNKNNWSLDTCELEYTDRMTDTVINDSSQYPSSAAVYNATHYINNDIISIDGSTASSTGAIIFPATISSVLVKIYIFIPTTKDASGVSWTINSLTGAIRTGGGGYISDGENYSTSSNWTTGSNISSADAFGKENGIAIIISSSSKFAAGGTGVLTNNSTLCYAPNQLLLTASTLSTT